LIKPIFYEDCTIQLQPMYRQSGHLRLFVLVPSSYECFVAGYIRWIKLTTLSCQSTLHSCIISYLSYCSLL